LILDNDEKQQQQYQWKPQKNVYSYNESPRRIRTSPDLHKYRDFFNLQPENLNGNGGI
jgi:hypothetical protein